MESNIWEPEPGIERRLDITGCCPKIEKICKPETCPTPDCPKHFEIIELSGNPQMCCKNYTCGILSFLSHTIINYITIQRKKINILHFICRTSQSLYL